MLRHGLARFTAAIFMVWFAAFMSGPSQLHLCPLHDGIASHGGHASTMPGHNMPGHAGHNCTCAGSCCSANHVVVPQVAVSVESTVEISDPSLSPYRAEYTGTAPKHLRPPSIGPPELHFV